MGLPDGDERETGHRLDGFDPDAALEELRTIARVISRAGQITDGRVAIERRTLMGHAYRMAALFDLLDHWLIVGQEPPHEWRWPDAQVAAEFALRRQPKRTTRAQRRA